MGYNPELWGRQAWHLIHMVALTYPEKPTEKDKKDYFKFFKSLQNVLPCPICAEHFRHNMEKKPIKLDNQKELFRWTVDIHNEVNKKNGKRVLSYDDALKEIQFNADKKDKDVTLKKALILSSTVSIFIVLFAYGLSKRK
jgi:hypothetical protein